MLIQCLLLSNHDSVINKPFLSTITLQRKLNSQCAIRLIILHSFYSVRAVRVPACLHNDNVKYSRCWRQSEPTAISHSAYPVTWDFYSKPKYNCFQTVPLPLLELQINIKTKCYDSKVNYPRSLWLYLLAYLFTLAVAREAWKTRPERCQCSAPPVELSGQLGAGACFSKVARTFRAYFGW